jgi:hypothetical protein
VIRLRSSFERARAHPVLGPLLLIALVFLLAMVFLHVVEEGFEASTEFGAMCIAVVTVLGLFLVSARFRLRVPELLGSSDSRGPPVSNRLSLLLPERSPPLAASIPLRR